MKNKTCYLIRGLPGSAKSTLASKWANFNHVWDEELGTYVIPHYEADMYFVDSDGNYNFNSKGIGCAHEFCQNNVEQAMKKGYHTVVISNTMTTRKEIKPYLNLCNKYHYTPFIIHCENDFGNVHDVPSETLAKMKQRWEPYRA